MANEIHNQPTVQNQPLLRDTELGFAVYMAIGAHRDLLEAQYKDTPGLVDATESAVCASIDASLAATSTWPVDELGGVPASEAITLNSKQRRVVLSALTWTVLDGAINSYGESDSGPDGQVARASNRKLAEAALHQLTAQEVEERNAALARNLSRGGTRTVRAPHVPVQPGEHGHVQRVYAPRHARKVVGHGQHAPQSRRTHV